MVNGHQKMADSLPLLTTDQMVEVDRIMIEDLQIEGRLFVADISVPPSVYPRLGVHEMPAFRTGWIAEVVDTVDPATPAGLSESQALTS